MCLYSVSFSADFVRHDVAELTCMYIYIHDMKTCWPVIKIITVHSLCDRSTRYRIFENKIY